VRALQDLGCIELVDTAQRRGAIEHYYRAVVRPFFSDSDWKRIPRSGRQAISDSILQILWEDLSESMKAGTFEARTDRHLTHSPMVLDDQGWAEVNRLMVEALEQAEKVGRESAGRLKKSGDEGIPTRVVLMQFETPDGQES